MRSRFTRITATALAGLALSLLPAPAAHAQAEAGGAVPEKPRAQTKERTGPASISDMDRGTGGDLAREALADQKRDEAIVQLRDKIIPKITDPSMKADLLFQLAELWWEKSKFVYFREMEAWDAAYAEWVEATNRGEKQEEPKADHTESDGHRKEAIELYREILASYPTYMRNDEVLFNLAFNMYETDQKEKAVALYWDLIKKYPSSPFVADAYLQMGEHFFNGNDVFKAQKAYQEAMAAGDDRVDNYALYKLAWCDFNLGEYKGALQKFDEVVLTAEKAEQADPSKRGRIQLKQEALRDMVLTYVMLDTVKPALDYYEQHGEEGTHRYIASLADNFMATGKHEPAIDVYRYLIARDAGHVDAPEYQSQIVHAYAAMEERQQVLAEMARLVDVYGPNGPWAQANAGNAAALERAYELAEGTQRNLVTEYHQEAQKTKYAETYRLAAEIYRRYLEKFSDSEHAYKLRYYYAEILYTLEEYELAADQYLGVVKADALGPYTLTAAYNALLSYEKLAAIARGDVKRADLSGKQKIDEGKDKGEVTKQRIYRRASKDDEAEEIPQWEVKQIEASDAYVAVVDHWREKNAAELGAKRLKQLEDDEIVVRYKAAFLLYEHRHYADAAQRFEGIILKWPGDPWATKAADLILDSLNIKEQWVQLNDLSRKFRSNERLVKAGGKDFTTRLDGLIEGSQFKIVLDVAAEGKDREAVAGYVAFVDEFPKSQYADTALYNAVMLYSKLQELDHAIEVAKRLHDSYEDSELRPMAVQYLGSLHEQVADYRAAAAWYETYADRYLDVKGENFTRIVKGKKDFELEQAKEMQDKVRKALPDNLFNAALWYEGLGEFEKAAYNYQRYVKAFPKDEHTPDVAYSLALLRLQQKDHQGAAEALEAWVKTYGSAQPGDRVIVARHRAALAWRDAGESRKAETIYQDLVKAWGRLSADIQEKPAVRDAVAHAAFRLLEAQYREYDAIDFGTVNQRELEKRLTRKTQGLADLEKAYAEVIAYGSGDWGIAALTRIGLGYQDLARAFLEAPIPPNLDEDQQEMYRAFLEEKAFPLEEKAIEALEKALVKSYELPVYNEWTHEAQNVLLAFKPSAYGKIHDVRYFGSEFFITAPWQEVLAEEPIVPEPAPAAADPASQTAGVREARR